METLKEKYIKHFLFHFGVHQNVFPLKFRVTLTLTPSSDLDRFDANIWSFFSPTQYLSDISGIKGMFLVFETATEETSELPITRVYNCFVKLYLFFFIWHA